MANGGAQNSRSPSLPKRSKKPLNSFVEALRNELDNFKGTYDQVADQSDDEFLKLMIRDGCFILEVLNVYSKNVIYAPDDPTFGTHGSTVLPLIKRRYVAARKSGAIWSCQDTISGCGGAAGEFM